MRAQKINRTLLVVALATVIAGCAITAPAIPPYPHQGTDEASNYLNMVGSQLCRTHCASFNLLTPETFTLYERLQAQGVAVPSPEDLFRKDCQQGA